MDTTGLVPPPPQLDSYLHTLFVRRAEVGKYLKGAGILAADQLLPALKHTVAAGGNVVTTGVFLPWKGCLDCIEGMTLEEALNKDVEAADAYQWANTVFEAARERLLSTEAKWIVEYSDAVQEKTKEDGHAYTNKHLNKMGKPDGLEWNTSLRLLPSNHLPGKPMTRKFLLRFSFGYAARVKLRTLCQHQKDAAAMRPPVAAPAEPVQDQNAGQDQEVGQVETAPEKETAPESAWGAPDEDEALAVARLARMRALAMERGNELKEKKVRARQLREERAQATNVDVQRTEPTSETETVAHVGDKRKHDTVDAADGKEASKPIELDGSGGSDTESGGPEPLVQLSQEACAEAEVEAEPAPRAEGGSAMCAAALDWRTALPALTTDQLAAAVAKRQKKEAQKQQAVELAAALNAAGGPAPETPAFREVLVAHGAESEAPSDSQ